MNVNDYKRIADVYSFFVSIFHLLIIISYVFDKSEINFYGWWIYLTFNFFIKKRHSEKILMNLYLLTKNEIDILFDYLNSMNSSEK